MTIKDFLIELEQALEGEIPVDEIKSNIKYYEGYMQSQKNQKTEEEITGGLGDPRLIARTIIDTYQMNHGSNRHYSYDYETTEGRYNNASSYSSSDYQQQTDSYTSNHNDSYTNKNPKVHTFRMPGWLLTVIVILILAVLFNIVFWIGGIVLRIFIKIGLPILLVYLGITLIRNMRR